MDEHWRLGDGLFTTSDCKYTEREAEDDEGYRQWNRNAD
jgi:hypothetical protein